MRLTTILQNQDSFSTDEYAQRVTTLVDALDRKKMPSWVLALRHNGFLAGGLMYLCAGPFDVIVTVGHRPAMIYGLLSRIAPRRGKLHIAKEFFFEEAPASANFLRKRIFSSLYRFSFKNLRAIIVNARAEVAAYAHMLGLAKERFFFIPWPSNIKDPEIHWGHDGSVFAVGRSLRDWETLFLAVENLPLKIVVIATRADVENLRVPANVELHCDISRDRYLNLLKQAKLVVIPLKYTQRSTGQASFLEAMAYGKPVIAASVPGVWDYLTDQRNALLYPAGDAEALRTAICRLNGEEEYRRKIACAGFEDIIAHFNKKNYSISMLNVIDSLSSSRKLPV